MPPQLVDSGDPSRKEHSGTASIRPHHSSGHAAYVHECTVQEGGPLLRPRNHRRSLHAKKASSRLLSQGGLDRSAGQQVSVAVNVPSLNAYGYAARTVRLRTTCWLTSRSRTGM